MIDFDKIESGSKLDLSLAEYQELKKAYNNIGKIILYQELYNTSRTDTVLIEKKDLLKDVLIKHNHLIRALNNFKSMSVKEFKKYKRYSK